MNDFSVNSRHRLLDGRTEVRFATVREPEGKPMPIRRLLVMHFTAGWGLESSLHYWRTAAAKGACAHLLIDRDGTVVQCRPFNETAGHAGTSHWLDRKSGTMRRNLNHCSLGIELCNVGSLPRSTYPIVMGPPLGGQSIPSVEARHKGGGPKQKWEIFPLQQLAAARAVAAALVARYQLDDVVGHEDISPDRRQDPGPAFPMESFRAGLGFAHPL